MKSGCWFRWLLCFLAVTLGFFSSQSAQAATAPGFSITATNVSLSGQGTATTQFTLTSVGGFTGQVGVICSGPDPNLFPDIIFPDCSHPTQQFVIPANGSVSGTMGFYPPWQVETASTQRDKPSHPSRSLPLLAGTFAGLGLLGLRVKSRRVAMGIGVVCLGLLSGAIGCMGHSGLQMTPGTYTYTLSGSGLGVSATKQFTVTVHCDSCP